jgi:hypothetical protein
MILFNALDEFLKELEHDKYYIDRKIVRLTNLYRHSQITPVIRYLFVAATYKAGGEIVKFKQYCGDLWNMEQDKKAVEKSIEVQVAVEDACKRYGLEIRAGMYKEQDNGAQGK